MEEVKEFENSVFSAVNNGFISIPYLIMFPKISFSMIIIFWIILRKRIKKITLSLGFKI